MILPLSGLMPECKIDQLNKEMQERPACTYMTNSLILDVRRLCITNCCRSQTVEENLKNSKVSKAYSHHDSTVQKYQHILQMFTTDTFRRRDEKE